MSSELTTLLQRIRPPEPMKGTDEPPQLTDNLAALMNRIYDRQWQAETLEELVGLLVEIQGELRLIRHTRKCKRCKWECQIAIERYWGRNMPWYLNLEYELGMGEEVYEDDPLYKTAPRLDAYQIGSYWTGSSDDTIRFILDRMAWAEKLIVEDVMALVDYYFAVENWNLELPRPQPDTNVYWRLLY